MGSKRSKKLGTAFLVAAMCWVVVGTGSSVASADSPERTCTYSPASPDILVAWDIADAKRVHVRADGGWLATVEPPETSVRVDRTTGYFVRVKLVTGDRLDIPCTEKPNLPVTVSASHDPACGVRESRFGAFLEVENTIGSLNLRDESGWVRTLFKNDPATIVPQLKDSYVVVNRNPVQGKLTAPCELGGIPQATAIYGGTKEREPGLTPTNGDWEIVWRDVVNGVAALENRAMGESRWVTSGFVEVGPTAVSADGSIFILKDSDRPLLEFEVHLDTAPGQLTYYSVGRD